MDGLPTNRALLESDTLALSSVPKSANWVQEEQQILIALQGLQQDNPERIMDGVRILELANKAYFLYLKQPPVEKAKLLRIVLSSPQRFTIGGTAFQSGLIQT